MIIKSGGHLEGPVCEDFRSSAAKNEPCHGYEGQLPFNFACLKTNYFDEI